MSSLEREQDAHLIIIDHMKAVVKQYEELMAGIEPRQGKLESSFFSSVTGHYVASAASLSPSYWAQI